MKKAAILGSTGSVGLNALRVLNNFNDFKVDCLTAHSNLELLARQADFYKPLYLGIADKKDYPLFIKKISYRPKEIFFGIEGIKDICRLRHAGIIIMALPGFKALLPLIESIKTEKKIILANKEALISAGQIIVNLLKKYKAQLIPADSEHNAVFQCLRGEDLKKVKRVILTASGGPFYGYKKSQLRNVTPALALRHPRWRMGRKITIDSATLMNKGLEVIEAKWLFNMPIEKIDVVIHKEAIIHSMVEFVDGNIKALLGCPDMRLPIQYALTFPERKSSPINLSFNDFKTITFSRPDFRKFPALKLAFEAGKIGATMPAVLNASNEIAVESFLKGKILFTDITKIVEKVMLKHTCKSAVSLADVLETDEWARREAERLCTG